MRGSMIIKLGMGAVALCLLVSGAGAATWIDTFDGGIEGWQTDSDPRGGTPEETTPSAVDVDGDGDTELQIQADGSPANSTDYIYMDKDVGATVLGEATGGDGDLTDVDFGVGQDSTVRYVTFDFWANADKGTPSNPHEPAALEFYFLTTAGTEWRLTIFDDVTGSLVDGMNSLLVSLWSQGDFYLAGGSESFADSLDNVEEMGIILSYQNWGGQEYGIEDFELHNPEPGTYAVLAFALVSLGVTFRGKLRSGIKGLLRK